MALCSAALFIAGVVATLEINFLAYPNELSGSTGAQL
jgi:hypothetical protein